MRLIDVVFYGKGGKMELITSMVEKYGSVLDWQTVEHSDQVLESVALDDIWGISKKWKNKQQTIGIQNALMIKCSNILIQPIHQRMPVIIRPEHYKAWLDKSLLPNEAQQLLALDAYENIHFMPISNWVNNPQHNDPRCLY